MTTLPADEQVKRLRACANDPMWADHAEIPKRWCADAADLIEAQAAELSSLRAKLAEAMEVTPEMLAAAWAAWKQRHGGKLGPGPAFREAIEAAFAARRLIEGNGK